MPLAGNRRDEKVLPLWEHVTELAKLLRIWIYTFVVATVAFMVVPADLSFLRDPFAFYRPLIAAVLQATRSWLLPPDFQLIALSFTDPIELYVITSVVFGFITSVPVLAYEIYRFVDPALRPSERSAVYPFVATFTLLFAAGAIFGFFVLLPFVIFGTILFFRVFGLPLLVGVNDFYNLVFFTVLMTGFAFTLPTFLVILVKFGIAGTGFLTKNRKYVWVSVFILTAIVTPDGGPIADLALFVPIIILLEASVLVAKRYERGRPRKEERPKPETLTCGFCGGLIDPSGVFCGRCGKSRL